MRRLFAFSLVWLAAFAFTGQIQAEFRVRPPADNSSGDDSDQDRERDRDRDGNEEPPGNEQPDGNPLKRIVHNVFKRLDANKDGLIDFREASKWLKKRFDKVDRNRDGKIDPKEYMGMILRHRGEDRPEKKEREGDPPQY